MSILARAKRTRENKNRSKVALSKTKHSKESTTATSSHVHNASTRLGVSMRIYTDMWSQTPKASKRGREKSVCSKKEPVATSTGPGRQPTVTHPRMCARACVHLSSALNARFESERQRENNVSPECMHFFRTIVASEESCIDWRN